MHWIRILTQNICASTAECNIVRDSAYAALRYYVIKRRWLYFCFRQRSAVWMQVLHLGLTILWKDNHSYAYSWWLVTGQYMCINVILFWPISIGVQRHRCKRERNKGTSNRFWVERLVKSALWIKRSVKSALLFDPVSEKRSLSWHGQCSEL